MIRRALAGALASVLTFGSCDAVPVPAFTATPAATETATISGPIADYITERGRRVHIERVVDGDTIAVTGDERIRLLTINAPELHATTKADDADCGAEAAAAALAQLLPVGTEIAVNGLKGEPAQDRYGRTLANVYLQQGDQLVNVSLWLVAQGWARVYDAYPTSDTEAAAALESDAQAAQRGMWSTC